MDEALVQYSVRESNKAKNPRLKVSVRHGLEVIVPKGYDNSKVPGILRRKRHWIKAALERVELNRKFFEPKPEWRLPTSISLPAIGEIWHFEVKASEYPAVAVRVVSPGRLLVFGQILDEQACIAALRRWLHRRARESLPPILEKVSGRTGLRFTRVFIKRQRTRWASCSRNQAISLNVKLLFLRPELVEYCMTHELCHVAEMNHSKKFWSLLRAHSPNYQSQDRMLRDAWKSLPRWV
ncbi:MAG: SprT family zinc-dependent metalloprotease [Thermodesulfobacteriota bacterium]